MLQLITKIEHTYRGYSEREVIFNVDYKNKTIEVNNKLTVQEFYSGLKEMAMEYRIMWENCWGYDSELMFDVGQLDFNENKTPKVDLIFIIQKDWDISKIVGKLTNGLLFVRGDYVPKNTVLIYTGEKDNE